MALRIKLKNSVVQDRVPTTSDLPEVGELAVNANINSIGGFMRASDNSVVKIFGPGSLSTPTATTSVSGISELATNSETTTGTATNRVVTPAGLNAVTVAERSTSNSTYLALAGGTLTGVLAVTAGSNSAPSIHFGDSDSGIFGGTNTVSLAAGGTTRLTAGTGVNINGTLAVTGAITSTSDLTVAEKVIHAGDTDTFVRFPAANTVSVETGGNESLRVDSSQRLLVGTSTARSNFFNLASTHTPRVQIEAANTNDGRAALGLTHGAASIIGPYIALAKHRSNSIGGQVIVNDDDQTGIISFQGSDGSEFVDTARITAFVDGTPGANDMPGRLVFSTTADGAATPTTRLTIDSAGLVKLPDNGKFVAGAGSDLQIYHNGTVNIIDLANSNNLDVKNGSEFVARFAPNGNNELFFDNSKKFETTSGGVSIPTDSTFLQIGAGQDLDLHHNGTNSFIRNKTGNLHIRPLVAEEGIILKPNGAVELYFDNVKKLYTYSDGAKIEGDFIFRQADGTTKASWSGSENRIKVNDGTKFIAGDGDDLQIYHNGQHSFIQHTQGSGNFFIDSAANISLRTATNETSIACGSNGAVELYHDGSKKLETISSGVTITGNLLATGNLNVNDNGDINVGNSGDLQLFHNGTNSFIDSDTGNLVISSVNDLRFNSADYKFMNTADNETLARFIQNGAVELYHDGSKKFETTSTGNQSTGVHKFITGSGSTSSDDNVLHIVAGGTADRGIMIGTGRGGGVSQNDGMGYIDAINSESNGHGSQLQFRVDGTAVMSIGSQSNDFVGINTTTPAVPLDIVGSIRVRDNADDAFQGLRIINTKNNANAPDSAFIRLGVTNAGGEKVCSIRALQEGNAANAVGLTFNTNSSGGNNSETEKMRLTSEGKLGLGTTSPDVMLDIRANDPGIQLLDTSSTNAYGNMDFVGDTLVLTSRGGTSSHGFTDFRTFDGSTIRTNMRIDSSGNLLVNTTSSITDTKAVIDGNLTLRNASTGSNSIVKTCVLSKAYSMSTSTVNVLTFDAYGNGCADITCFRKDTGSPQGGAIHKIYLGFRGSGSNMSDVSIAQENKVSEGNIHSVTFSAVASNNDVILKVTGDDNGGEAQELVFFIQIHGKTDGSITVN